MKLVQCDCDLASIVDILMAWCFSTRASVASVLSMQPWQWGKLTLAARQYECILSWARRKLAGASGILYRIYKGHMFHYDDVIMSEIASQITSLTIVYSTVHSGADQSKHQSSASLAFVWEIHRWPVNFPHKWPVTRKIFPFDDVIMFRASAPKI